MAVAALCYNRRGGPAPARRRAGPNPQELSLEPSELAHQLVDIAEARKASDIVLLDIRPVSLIADYFLVVSGTSDRQLRAIAAEIRRRLKEEHDLTPLNAEGTPESGWVVLDYGGVVAHIMSPGLRRYYALEELWQGAQLVVRIIE